MGNTREGFIAASLIVGLLIGGFAWYQQPTFRQARLNQRLIAAVQAKDVPGVRATLAAGANPNARDYYIAPPTLWERLRYSAHAREQEQYHVSYWYSVLAEAAQTGNVPITQALLNSGANVNEWGSNGDSTALDMAAFSLHPGISRHGLVLLLLRQGAAAGKNSALHAGIWSNDLPTVKLLLDSGANPNDQTFGLTPLADTVMHNQVAIAGLLLAYGADPNLKSRIVRQSPLALIKQWKQPDLQLAQLLRQAGAKSR